MSWVRFESGKKYSVLVESGLNQVRKDGSWVESETTLSPTQGALKLSQSPESSQTEKLKPSTTLLSDCRPDRDIRAGGLGGDNRGAIFAAGNGGASPQKPDGAAGNRRECRHRRKEGDMGRDGGGRRKENDTTCPCEGYMLHVQCLCLRCTGRVHRKFSFPCPFWSVLTGY